MAKKSYPIKHHYQAKYIRALWWNKGAKPWGLDRGYKAVQRYIQEQARLDRIQETRVVDRHMVARRYEDCTDKDAKRWVNAALLFLDYDLTQKNAKTNAFKERRTHDDSGDMEGDP